MPAHVTVLYPWLRSSAVTANALDRLSELCVRQVAFDVRFERIGRFPGTLWLDPTPTMRFSALTQAVHRAWPQAPPYRGRFETVIPHLTVADEQPPDVLDAAERAVERWLPIGSRVATLTLYAFDGERWRRRRRFPLGGASGHDTPTR